MPLYIGGEIVNEKFKSSRELFERFPDFKAKSQEFASEVTIKMPENEKLFYIGQREYGTVRPGDSSVTFIGSDSATTCQIVVLRNPDSQVCSLAHFDDAGIATALKNMVGSIAELSNEKSRLEMYVFGGFVDDRNISQDIFLKILHGASQLPGQVELVCACVCELNDQVVNDKHAPKNYGIGVFVTSGKVVPIQQFQCDIPDKNLRRTAMYADSESVRQVYTSRTQELTVDPYQFEFSQREARARAALPDDFILKYFSTSPHCEPPNFATNLREGFVFLSENASIHEKFFPCGKPRRFKRQENGKWSLI